MQEARGSSPLGSIAVVLQFPPLYAWLTAVIAGLHEHFLRCYGLLRGDCEKKSLPVVAASLTG